MLGNAKVVPLRGDCTQTGEQALRSDVHALIDHMPTDTLQAIRPVLAKYSVQYGLPGASGPEQGRPPIPYLRPASDEST